MFNTGPVTGREKRQHENKLRRAKERMLALIKSQDKNQKSEAAQELVSAYTSHIRDRLRTLVWQGTNSEFEFELYRILALLQQIVETDRRTKPIPKDMQEFLQNPSKIREAIEVAANAAKNREEKNP